MSPISSTTTVAHCDLGPISIKRKVLHSVFHRFWLPNNTGQFQAKGQLRSLTWGQFRATARLRTVFWTSFSFIRNVAHFKQNDSCGLWFGPISSQRTIAHNVFLKFYLSSKSTLAQCDLGQFPATGKFCTAFFTCFGFLTIRAIFKLNDSCAVPHRANFEQQQGCARCFGQV